MPMTKEQEFDEQSQSFYRVLEKLDLDDLKSLTYIFNCYPTYCGEVDKGLCMEHLWTKFREWRHGTDDARALRQALFVLGVRNG